MGYSGALRDYLLSTGFGLLFNSICSSSPSSNSHFSNWRSHNITLSPRILHNDSTLQSFLMLRVVDLVAASALKTVFAARGGPFVIGHLDRNHLSVVRSIWQQR